MEKYIELFDENKQPICGSDGVLRYDNRRNMIVALYDAGARIERQYTAWMTDPKKYVRPRAKYGRVIINLRNPIALTSMMELHNAF